MLTKEDINKVYNIQQEYLAKYFCWRKGQAFFNALHHLFPDEASKIVGTDIDPYHIDKNIEKCIEYLLNDE